MFLRLTDLEEGKLLNKGGFLVSPQRVSREARSFMFSFLRELKQPRATQKPPSVVREAPRKSVVVVDVAVKESPDPSKTAEQRAQKIRRIIEAFDHAGGGVEAISREMMLLVLPGEEERRRCVTPDCILDAARKAGASYMVVGSLVDQRPLQWFLDVSVLDVQTGEYVKGGKSRHVIGSGWAKSLEQTVANLILRHKRVR